MNQPLLTNSDISNLYHIVDEANRNYLKSSRINDKPAFNILRVLASLRLLFPQSPSSLYNAVIFITKNYDPQTYYHWKKAIEDINRNRNMVFKTKNNYCRPQIANYTKTYQNSFNRSRINESCEHLQSKSYAQIHIPQEISVSNQESFYGEDQKEHSQTNAETGKRQFYTKADSVSHVSKNHYISFEPYRKSTDKYHLNYDKENINSTNLEESRKRESSYQYIEAIQRDLNRTAIQSIKTPIDQSFIKNINSSESPYIYSKLQQECGDPIEEQMIARANTFYQFNLQLKVLSSLQANSYVFIKAKENEIKANIERRSKLLHKSFLALKNNVKIQQQERRKEEKAINFHTKNVQSKVYNVFKLVFDLRNTSLLQMTQDTSKMNRINYSFMFGLLFTLHNSREEQQQNQFIDFQSKIDELIHSDSANKLYLIVKYFGKHAWITEQNIQKLINQYKLTICKQVFRTLKHQRQANTKYDEVRMLNLKKQSFYVLKVRWNKFACYKKKIQTAQAKRNRSLLEKVMKSFLEIIYSTKLYSKRCEYIERKKLFHLKGRVCKLWVEEARKRLEKRKEMTCKGGVMLAKMQQFVKRFVFVKINEKVQEIDNKISLIISNNMLHRKIEVYNSLRSELQRQLKLKQADKLIEKLKCRLAVVKWKESTKKGKAISKMILNIKIHFFRSLVLPHLKDSIEIVKYIHSNETNLLRRMFEELKDYAVKQLITRQSCTLELQTKVKSLRRITAISCIRQNWQYEKQIKRRADLMRKTSKVITLKKNIDVQFFLDRFYSFYNQITEQKEIKSVFSNTLQTISSKRLLQRLQEQHQLRRNYSKLLNRVVRAKSRQASACFERTIRCSKAEKVKQLRKNRSSHEISMILRQMYEDECKKNQQAKEFCENQLKGNALSGFQMLVQQFKKVQELAQKVQYFLSQSIQRNTLQCIKQAFAHNTKQQKVRVLHKLGEKKIALGILAEQKFGKKQLNAFVSLRYKNMGSLLIKNLRSNIQSKHYSEINKKKIVQLQKATTISRLKNFYIHKIIENKHLYMALKFRALKLCIIAFSALSTFPSKKPQKKSFLLAHKGIAQRLSTDIIG